MYTVTDTQVAAQADKVTLLAKKLTGHAGAEYDDLYQEGITEAWLIMRDEGRDPTEREVANAQIRYIRKLRKLKSG